MSKIDTIFHEIISYEEMKNKFDYNPNDYLTISQGIKSSNKYVKALANMLLQYDNIVEEKKMNMRLTNKTGNVVIEESVMESIYRKFVKDLE